MTKKTGASMEWGGLDKGIKKAFKEFQERVEMMRTIGHALVISTERRFDEGKGPNGEEWKASRRSGKTLLKTGQLQRSISAKITTDTVYVGSNLKYARIHQLGGEIKPKNKKALKIPVGDGEFRIVKKVTMPARPYLGISEEDKEEVKAIIGEYIKGAFD